MALTVHKVPFSNRKARRYGIDDQLQEKPFAEEEKLHIK